MATTEIDPLQGFQQALDELDESMCLDAAKRAAQRIPEHEFLAFRQWVADDEPKRRELAASLAVAREEAADEVRAEIMDQIAEVAPELVTPPAVTDGPRPWKDWHPLKPETHFFYGDECVIDGRVFISRRDPDGRQPNVHSPLMPGAERFWEEKPPAADEPDEEPGEEGDEETAAPPPISYEGGRTWETGTLVTFDGATYRCKETHYAAPNWTPVNAHSMWEKLP